MNMQELSELRGYYKSIFQSGPNPISDDLLEALVDYDIVNEKSKAAKIEKDILPNTGQYHASIMMSKMLSLASKEVFMVLGRFKGEVSDNENYLEGLKAAIGKKVKFNIIFLDDNGPNLLSLAYKQLRTYKQEFPENVHFYQAGEEAKKILVSSLDINKEYHFSTFDDSIFRTELVPQSFAAVGSYHDEGRVKDLVQIFHVMEKVSHSLN